MKSREFLELAREALTEAFGPEAQTQVMGSLLKVWFERPEQHYEVWLRPQAGLIELGLHFEGARDDNYARIAVMAEAMPLIASELGPGVEAEEWTERWTRVHETMPLTALTPDLALEVCARVRHYVAVLEPLVRPLGPISPPVRGTGARRRVRRPRSFHP